MQTQSHAQRLIEGLLTKVWLLKRQEVFGGRDSETLLPPLGYREVGRRWVMMDMEMPRGGA